METATSNLPTEEPAKGSPSDPAAEEVQLMLVQLNRCGVAVPDPSPANIRARYARWREQQDAEAMAFNRKCEQAAKLRIAGHPIDAARRRWSEEAARNGAEYREVLRQQRISAAKLPDLHLRHGGKIDKGNAGWHEARNEMTGNLTADDGFLYVLLGPRGTGKTQMAVELVRDACRQLMRCRYLKAAQLFAAIRGTFNGKGTEDEVIRELTALDLLVIDECHQRGGTDFEQNTLVHLLDRRYDAQRCTLLIANQSKAEFAAAMGDSVVSRIHETGKAIECNWSSYRVPTP